MNNFLKTAVTKAAERLIIAMTVVVGMCGAIALGNYAMTQGSGTNFGSVVVSTVHYAQMMVCDLTTPSQCQSVSAAGSAKVDGAIADGATFTEGTTAANMIGGEYNTSPANCVSGKACGLQMTLDRQARVSDSALLAAVQAAVPAGTNLIGKFGIDQTTPGTTNGVQDASTGATGSAPPSKASYFGANASGATGGQIKGVVGCDSHVFKHITTATDTLAVQGVASQTIYICAWRSRAAGVATWFLENTGSANANCSSTNTQITGVATEAANSGEVFAPAFWNGLKNTSGNGLCINSTGTGGVDVDVWYSQF